MRREPNIRKGPAKPARDRSDRSVSQRRIRPLCDAAGVAQDAGNRPAAHGGGIFSALVPRTRSSHDFAAGTVANFGFKSGTSIIMLLEHFPLIMKHIPNCGSNWHIRRAERRRVDLR